MATLLEQIGGEAAVDAAVDIFYKKIIADDVVQPFFANTDMDSQSRKQKLFLTTVLNGTSKGALSYMRRVHKGLVHDQGLTDVHFDAVAHHLQGTLEELEVPTDLIGQIMESVGGMRDAVLDRDEAAAA
ncbi:MAG: group 1 truncated hemoglobin [Rhodospirillaceae bacterium]|nr:group 1 truncated hemoglobin [Rhodospirillaceae bacterium]MBT5241594.1 group 1 truncated hemoglobin [Rhodospirillaceae bacterium]MBT5567363.1 group 1 truncated hemoglobin [Rhodospirillaceae bacterium]MBT6089697.1 group 1 truncated hemoglobin [Rhodospirillaceae bacterium]MBT7449214.1 group 1 truncated hemoglobin [Rhodospirillaceae bacterium]